MKIAVPVPDIAQDDSAHSVENKPSARVPAWVLLLIGLGFLMTLAWLCLLVWVAFRMISMTSMN
jgi:hypothetical protein